MGARRRRMIVYVLNSWTRSYDKDRVRYEDKYTRVFANQITLDKFIADNTHLTHEYLEITVIE